MANRLYNNCRVFGTGEINNGYSGLTTNIDFALNDDGKIIAIAVCGCWTFDIRRFRLQSAAAEYLKQSKYISDFKSYR